MKLLIYSQTLTVTPLELGTDNQLHLTLCNGCNYVSMLGIRLIRVHKTGLWYIVPSVYRHNITNSALGAKSPVNR